MRSRGRPRRQRPGWMPCVADRSGKSPGKQRAHHAWLYAFVAPFAGIVTARMADPGTLASPGVPLLQIDQAGALQLQATVDESEIGAIHKGMKTQVAIDGASSANIAGHDRGDRSSRRPFNHSFLVKIDLPSSSQLRAGMYGTAEFANGVRRRFSFRVPPWSREDRSAVRMFSTPGNRATPLSHSRRDRKAISLKFCRASPRAKDLWTHPADRDLAGKRIEAQP
jgi:hypothetical protein